MKKCINCGKIEESSNAFVCSACGGNLVQQETLQREPYEENTAYYQATPTAPVQKKKRRKKIIISIFAAVVILATITAICLFALHADTPVQKKEKIVSVYAEGNCTYGIRADGTVTNSREGIYFSDEYNVTQISGDFALLDDGKVLTPAMRIDFSYDELSEQIFRQIEGWNNIVQIGASNTHVVGLTESGSVVAQLNDTLCKMLIHDIYEERNGDDLENIIQIANEHIEYCDVDSWENIIQVAVERGRTLGLKKDGTVVSAGLSDSEKQIIAEWKNIVQICVNGDWILGVQEDGAVVSVGLSEIMSSTIETWKDIIQVDTGGNHIVGLRRNRGVVAAGENTFGQCDLEDWGSISQIAAGSDHTVGLKFDGSIIVAGHNGAGQCNVDDWD